MKMKKMLYSLLSIPKTIYINLKMLKLQDAVRLPIIVHHKVKFIDLSGKIVLNAEPKLGMVKIGFGSSRVFDMNRRTTICIDGELIINGRVSIGNGSNIEISGVCQMGDNYIITANSKIICKEKIEFGENCMISWDCLIMDTDCHKIYSNDNTTINKNKMIIIGDNVWIGCRSVVMKGSKIKNNSIVGAQSIVAGEFEENNLIAGFPARKLKENIRWDY